MKSNKTINIVTIGHIDHGKSTLIGRMLYDSGAIKKERILDAEESAKELGKDTIEFSFLMDTFQEERSGGITIDIMHTPFKSEKNEYMFIDCPGHREFIKNMITGTSHADGALLLVSAKNGEGIQNQTREHLWLAKILGIEKIIVAINKMDVVGYSEERYEKIRGNVEDLLTSMNFKENDFRFVPISAIRGNNIYEKSDKMGWYEGKSLIEFMDMIFSSPIKLDDLPLRLVVQDTYKTDQGNIIVGRVETGQVKIGMDILFIPSKIKKTVRNIKIVGKDVKKACAGDSIGLILEDFNESVSRGDVGCSPKTPVNVGSAFTSQLYIMNPIEIRNDSLLDVRCGTSSTKCEVVEIINTIDPRTGVTSNAKESISFGDAATVKLKSNNPIPMELHSDIPPLGRFVVVDDGITKAYGIITEME